MIIEPLYFDPEPMITDPVIYAPEGGLLPEAGLLTDSDVHMFDNM
jgi:hypothetical protein